MFEQESSNTFSILPNPDTLPMRRTTHRRSPPLSNTPIHASICNVNVNLPELYHIVYNIIFQYLLSVSFQGIGVKKALEAFNLGNFRGRRNKIRFGTRINRIVHRKRERLINVRYWIKIEDGTHDGNRALGGIFVGIWAEGVGIETCTSQSSGRCQRWARIKSGSRRGPGLKEERIALVACYHHPGRRKGASENSPPISACFHFFAASPLPMECRHFAKMPQREIEIVDSRTRRSCEVLCSFKAGGGGRERWLVNWSILVGFRICL